jgi:hypothetical protein
VVRSLRFQSSLSLIYWGYCVLHAIYFLSFEVSQTFDGIFLSQRKYALELLEEIGYLGRKPTNTSLDSKHKYCIGDYPLFSDVSHFRSLIKRLFYLTHKRADIFFVVQQLNQFLSCPTTQHV